LLECVMDPLLLVPGRYRVAGAVIFHGEVQHHVENLGAFIVSAGSINGNRISDQQSCGLVHLPHQWHVYEEQLHVLCPQ
jgi:hypothetical protein